jgi:exosortase
MADISTVVSEKDPKGKGERTSWLELEKHVYIKIGIIAALLCWLFWREMYILFYQWTNDASWSHGFLIPLFSLYLINQHKKDILNLEYKPSWFGFAMLVFIILLYPLNIVQLKIGYLKPLLLIATIGCVVLFVGGWRLVRYAWLPVIYLVFAVPIPDRLYKAITIPMRIWAANISTDVLNFIPGMEANANGVVIDIVYNGVPLQPSLDVAEACSGMRLLMAFLALGVAMAYLHYRPAWQRAVLLLSTVPIAILCNIVRVTITSLIYVMIDPKYAQGIYHDMLGIAMLPLAFAMYGGLAVLMANIFVDEDEDEAVDIVVRKGAVQKTGGEGDTHE